MSRGFLALLTTLALSSDAAAQVTRFGRLANELTSRDVSQIVRLASAGSRKPWLLDTYTSQTLPETWYVQALIEPSSEQRGMRRGDVVLLESRVANGVAQRWRVTGHSKRWAQVALPGRGMPTDVGEDALDRPFLVDGPFSDGELMRLVEYVRSSPRMPPAALAADRSSVDVGPDTLDGRLRIGSVERIDSLNAQVWVGDRNGLSLRGDFVLRDGRWAVVKVIWGGVP